MPFDYVVQGALTLPILTNPALAVDTVTNYLYVSNGANGLWSLANTLTATGTLTSTQINALGSTPVILILAPGAGKAIYVKNAQWNMIFGGTPFTTTATTALVYGTTSVAASSSLAAALLTTSANTAAFSSSLTQQGTASSNMVNQSIQITASAAISAGNGTLNYRLEYIILLLS